MANEIKWKRVTKSDPCQICGKDTWCMVGYRFICCMRIQSTMPSKSTMGGWLHGIGGNVTAPMPKRKEPEVPTIDATAIMRNLWHETTDRMRADLAIKLGVSPLALRNIGACWFPGHRAWAFPMFNGQRQCVGIRLRSESGFKWAITGSHQGIFWPKRESNGTIYIVEGPTDCAAALTLDLFAVGRPSCLGCIPIIQVAVNQLQAKRAVLIADNDTPGINGAKSLANDLQIPCAHVLLPCKDLRQFVQFGGTRRFIESKINNLVWHQPERSATPA